MLNLDDPRLRLNDLLEGYDALSTPKGSVTLRDQSGQQSTFEAFDHLVRDVIRPAMEKIGAALQGRGHDYEIVISPGQRIVMYFYPPLLRRPAYSSSCCPYVSFSSDPSTAKIHVVQGTMMPNGHGRTETVVAFSADQVTRHCAETQILNALENVVAVLEG